MSDDPTPGPTRPNEPTHRKSKHAKHGAAYYIERAPENASWEEIRAAADAGELPEGWSL